MCGIAGIHALAGSCGPQERAWVERANAAMQRRGPDGEGLWREPQGRAVYGHRRLSIIDLSDAGAQPMASADGSLVISFNGEIYNYRALRDALQRQGHVFRTQSDTEVLLALYRQHGTDMFRHLRGMYAFALWDAKQGATLLARDAFGIKPLYYAADARAVRFASQVKALLAAGDVDTTPEPAGHAGFLLWGSVPQPWTLYRGIRALPAGHAMWLDHRGAGAPWQHACVTQLIGQAWQGAISRRQALDDLAQSIRDSVTAHHVADVPVGVFLSAGMDSCLIAALSSEQGHAAAAVTLAFSEYAGTRHDEAPLAAAVARHVAARHTVTTVRADDFRIERAAILQAMDQPTIDGVNTWFVSKAAAQLGWKVALSGLGADELLGSYPSFRDVPRIRSFAAPVRTWPGLGRVVRKALLPLLRGRASPKYAGLLELGGTTEGAYLLRRCLQLPIEVERVLGPEMARAGFDKLATLHALQDTTRGLEDDYARIAALESSWYMRNQLLADTDWASMAHSLEVRVPLVDQQVLRAAVRCQHADAALRKADMVRHIAPGLPEAVLKRPKSGFIVPVRDWLLRDQPQASARGLRGWASYVHAAFAGEVA